MQILLPGDPTTVKGEQSAIEATSPIQRIILNWGNFPFPESAGDGIYQDVYQVRLAFLEFFREQIGFNPFLSAVTTLKEALKEEYPELYSKLLELIEDTVSTLKTDTKLALTLDQRKRLLSEDETYYLISQFVRTKKDTAHDEEATILLDQISKLNERAKAEAEPGKTQVEAESLLQEIETLIQGSITKMVEGLKSWKSRVYDTEQIKKFEGQIQGLEKLLTRPGESTGRSILDRYDLLSTTDYAEELVVKVRGGFASDAYYDFDDAAKTQIANAQRLARFYMAASLKLESLIQMVQGEGTLTRN